MAATTESGQAALASATLPADMIVWASDPEVPEAYPIVTYTWLLCRGRYRDTREAETLKKVITYGLDEGQKVSADLGYIPLPPDIVGKVRAALDTIRDEP